MSDTKRVVINACFGGFSLSDAAERRYAVVKGLFIVESTEFGRTWLHMATTPDADPKSTKDNDKFTSSRDIARDDPVLVQIVEEMGEAANGEHAELRIVEIPAGVEFEISEYDGREHIAETHRTWYAQ